MCVHTRVTATTWASARRVTASGTGSRSTMPLAGTVSPTAGSASLTWLAGGGGGGGGGGPGAARGAPPPAALTPPPRRRSARHHELPPGRHSFPFARYLI